MKGFSTELKVGAFVIAALITAGFMAMKTGHDVWMKKAGYSVYSYFSDTSGLDKKTRVKIAGVDVGVVEDITLKGNIAKVKIHLIPEVKLYEDAVASIKATGMMGDKVLDIQPGSSGSIIADGGTIRNTKEPFDMDALTSKINVLADGLERLIANLNEMFATDETKRLVHDTLQNVADLTSNLKAAISSGDQDLKDSLKNLNKLIDSLNHLVENENGDINQTIANLRDVSKNLKDFTDQNAKKLNSIAENADKTLSSISRVTEKIEKGEGTIGKIVNDDSLYNSINNTAKRIEQMMEKVDRVKTYIGLRGEYLTAAKGVRGNFDVTLMPSPQQYYILGVVSDPVGTLSSTQHSIITSGGDKFNYSDTTISHNNIQFNAQFARRYNDTVLRFGLTQNTFGFGADQYILNNNLKVFADMFDFNNYEINSPNPHLKLGLDYYFFKRFYVTAGADNVLNPAWAGMFLGGGFTIEDADLKYLFGVLPKISP